MKRTVTLRISPFVVCCFVFLFSFQLTAQTQLLNGVVMDEQNQPLPGVNVVLKGTNTGTSTDVEGKFQLSITDNDRNSFLIFSTIGYVQNEVKIGITNSFTIFMKEDVKSLNEVVITGYSAQDKDKISGAVTTVSAETLIKVPVPSVDQALQGRAPGVMVAQNTGAPGDGVSVRIRGIGSINSGNYPLYIVDGVPTLDISNFSPNDIETITVLKDASAAAIYGARAANGVVVITTKSGVAQKPVITINSQFGFQQPSRLIKMVDTNEYASIYNEMATNDNVGKPVFLQRPFITEAIKDTLANTNWLKEIMRTGMLQVHNLSIAGGDGKTKYYVAANYYGQKGIIKSSDYQRLTGRLNLSSELKSWLKTGINLNVANGTTDIIGSSGDGAGGNGGGIVRYAFFRNPALPVYNRDGSFQDLPLFPKSAPSTYSAASMFGDGYNPVGMLAYNNNKKTSTQVFGKYFLEFQLIKGLKLTSNFGFDLSYYNQRRFDRQWGTNGRINNPNSLQVYSGKAQNFTYSNFLAYTKKWSNHTFSALLGTEAIKNSSYDSYANDNKFPDQDPSLVYLGNGLGNKISNESVNRNSLLSYFTKIDYSFKDKYNVSATIRRDASSRFGPANRWGNFYSASAGWRMDKENFMLNSRLFDQVLWRVGYGVIGNQEIGNYAFSDRISTNYNYPIGNTRTYGYAVTALGNNKIKWETSTQLNAGVNVVMYEGKLSFSIDYYRKVTSNLLVKQSIASSAGQADAPWVNNGKVLNRGFEFVISHNGQVGKFKYTANLNGATLFNKVLAIESPILKGQVSGPITRTEKGSQIGDFYLLEREGVFQDNAQIFTHAYQGANIQPGDLMFKDQDKNGVIDGNDRRHFGNAIPKITTGLNIGLSYMQWDLNLFVQGAYGQKIYSVLNMDIEGYYRGFPVTQRYFDQRWHGVGTSNTQPRASWDAAGNNARISSRFLESGSYTRLKNIQLGYTLPADMIKKLQIVSARVYFSVTNLLTFTKYSGLDPEMTVSNNSTGDGDAAMGIDWGTYPSAKSFNMGINLSF